MTYENPVNGINQMGYSGVYSSKRLSIACHLALRRIASGLSSGTLWPSPALHHGQRVLSSGTLWPSPALHGTLWPAGAFLWPSPALHGTAPGKEGAACPQHLLTNR